jgi:hypothetical protein
VPWCSVRDWLGCRYNFLKFGCSASVVSELNKGSHGWKSLTDAVPGVAALAGSRQCLNSRVLNLSLKESWFLFQSAETTRAFQARCISMREAGVAGNERIQPCTAAHVDLPVTCSLSEDALLTRRTTKWRSECSRAPFWQHPVKQFSGV